MEYKKFIQEQFCCFADKNGHYVFSTDVLNNDDVIDSCGRELLKNEYKKIHHNLFPQPVIGDLENGKVFICSLNPGFGNQDYNDEEIIRTEIMRQFKKDNAEMFYLSNDPAIGLTGGSKWWRSRFDQSDQNKSLINNICRGYRAAGFPIDKCDVFSMLSRIVVALELFPYHSKTMNWQAIRRCEGKNGSVTKMRAFVHNELIPHAKEKQQIICFTRSIRQWEVTEEEKQMADVVFCNPANYSEMITFNVKLALGGFIYDHIKRITDDFTKVL